MTCAIDPKRDGDCWNTRCHEHNPDTAAQLEELEDDFHRAEAEQDAYRRRWNRWADEERER